MCRRRAWPIAYSCSSHYHVSSCLLRCILCYLLDRVTAALVCIVACGFIKLCLSNCLKSTTSPAPSERPIQRPPRENAPLRSVAAHVLQPSYVYLPPETSCRQLGNFETLATLRVDTGLLPFVYIFRSFVLAVAQSNCRNGASEEEPPTYDDVMNARHDLPRY